MRDKSEKVEIGLAGAVGGRVILGISPVYQARRDTMNSKYFKVEVFVSHLGRRRFRKKPETHFLVKHNTGRTAVDVLMAVCRELGGTTKKKGASVLSISADEFEETRGDLYKRVAGYSIYHLR